MLHDDINILIIFAFAIILIFAFVSSIISDAIIDYFVADFTQYFNTLQYFEFTSLPSFAMARHAARLLY